MKKNRKYIHHYNTIFHQIANTSKNIVLHGKLINESVLNWQIKRNDWKLENKDQKETTW